MSLISNRALVMEWAGYISFKNSHSITNVINWKKSGVVRIHGLSLIMAHKQDYESGDEGHNEILEK